MNHASKIFTKGDRELIHDILRGRTVKTKGVKIEWFMRKINAKLQEMGCKPMSIETMNQRLFWKTINTELWNAAYLVCEDERPGLFDELKKEQEEAALVEAETI